MKKFFLIGFFAVTGLALIGILFFTIRQSLVKREIEHEWQTPPSAAPALATTSRLEIIPLYEEASADESFEFGHGVSYLIRTDSATILMDVGNNPTEAAQLPSIQNMQSLGITWEEVDAVLISHPHPDHIGGVKAWQTKTISFGNFTSDLSKMTIYVPSPITYSGATLVRSSEPTLISTDIGTTGVISYSEVYPLLLFNPKGYEQALVIHVAGEGLVVITGCGHPTLEKLVERAEALYGQQVVGVVGGLHYEGASTEDVQPHIQFLNSHNTKLVALSPHDSSPEALEAFQSAFTDRYYTLKVGEAIQFP